MITERMLEFIILQKIMSKDLVVDYSKYDRRKIGKRYLSLKREFLEPYKLESNPKGE